MAVCVQSLQQEWSMVCEALHLQPPLRADDPNLSRVAVALAIQPQHAIPETPALKVRLIKLACLSLIHCTEHASGLHHVQAPVAWSSSPNPRAHRPAKLLTEGCGACRLLAEEAGSSVKPFGQLAACPWWLLRATVCIGTGKHSPGPSLSSILPPAQIAAASPCGRASAAPPAGTQEREGLGGT